LASTKPRPIIIHLAPPRPRRAGSASSYMSWGQLISSVFRK